MLKPGPRNLITDVDGLLVGNAEDARLRSGVSVLMGERPFVASVDVRGGGPGTRDTDLLDPSCRVDRADAICLSGGSAYGLSAADGVMRWMRERGRGLAVGSAVVPIVPSAILFDLLNGGDKGWDWPPYRELAYQASGQCRARLRARQCRRRAGCQGGQPQGRAGQFLGGRPGEWPAGRRPGGGECPGYATMGDMPQFWAWALEQNGEFGGLPPPAHNLALAVSHSRADLTHDLADVARSDPRANTTIAVVATNARLDKASAQRIAMMAQDGLARSLRPVHTPQDGDTVFAVATGTHDLGVDPLALGELGTLAADCLARAVARGVYNAASLGPARGWRDVFSR